MHRLTTITPHKLMTRRSALALFGVVAWGAEPPRRIVSTAPSITEMLFALGVGPRVVGVTSFCRFPAEVASLPKAGSYIRPNLEAILALEPDLVIIQENPIRLRAQLEALRLSVLELEHSSLSHIRSSIERIATACGVEEEGRKLNQSILDGLEQVKHRTRGLPKTRVLVVVSRSPGRVAGLVAAGRGSFLDEVIGVAGGVNVLADTPATYPGISLEQVLSRNPEVILDLAESSHGGGSDEARPGEALAHWGRHKSLAAVRNGRVHRIVSDSFVVPGPRVVEAARECARLLHPEAGL